MKNNRLPLIILLSATAAGIFFRLYPVTHNKAFREENNAKLIVYINISNSIRQDVERSFPNLTAEQKDQLHTKMLADIMKADKPRIDSLIKILAAKQAKDSQSPLYLLEVDPYYYLGLTNNLIQKGNLGGERRGIKYFNPLMMAPAGCWYNFDLHPYVGFYIYKALSLFNRNISVEAAVSLAPVLLFILAMIIFFWWLKGVLAVDNFPLALGLLYAACFPALIFRNSFGWFDTDIYNVIFPLLIIVALSKALSLLKNRKLSILWVLLAGLFSALYSLFWRGWIYLPVFVGTVFLLIIILSAVFKKLRQQNIGLLKLLIIYGFGIIFFSFVFIGPEGLQQSFEQSAEIVASFLNFKPSAWPDVFITIGELRKPEYKSAISSLGGIFVIVFAIVGFLHTLLFGLRRVWAGGVALRNLFLLILSALLVIFSLSAERFLLFLLIPMVTFFTSGIVSLSEISSGSKAASRKVKIPQWVFKALPSSVKVIAAMLMFTVVVNAHAIAAVQFTIVNDAWMKMLVAIRDRTPENSIVNSWWCPGHYITAVAKRRVTFDGATQNTPIGYWMARALISDNERQCLGILRMLNTSGNKAYEFLTGLGYKTSDAIDILNVILPLPKRMAYLKAAALLPEDKCAQLIALTHGVPPASYCFIYNDLIHSIILFKYFGNWDFHKMEGFNEIRHSHAKQAGEIMQFGGQGYKEFLWSIAGGQPYVEDESFESNRKGSAVYFGNGVSVDLVTKECSLVPAVGKGSARPHSIFYLEGDVLKEKEFADTTVNLSVLLIPRGDQFSCVIADREFADSVVFRLYYLAGKGLRFFKPFDQIEDAVNQTRIHVYEIDWKNFIPLDDALGG